MRRTNDGKEQGKYKTAAAIAEGEDRMRYARSGLQSESRQGVIALIHLHIKVRVPCQIIETHDLQASC